MVLQPDTPHRRRRIASGRPLPLPRKRFQGRPGPAGPWVLPGRVGRLARSGARFHSHLQRVGRHRRTTRGRW